MISGINAAPKSSTWDHPYYLHALSDLRAARWMIEHRPGDWQRTVDEMDAVKRIDEAIGEINADEHRFMMPFDEYVAKKAYVAVFGYQKFPFFTSDRINYSQIVPPKASSAGVLTRSVSCAVLVPFQRHRNVKQSNP